MSLVSVATVKNQLKLNRFGFLGTAVVWVLFRLTKLHIINKRYQKNQHLSCQDFIEVTLKEYKITYRIPQKDWNNIPKEGAFISVSNHPFGGIEGLIILKTFQEIRPDYKAIANYLLQNFKPLASSIIAVNPFEQKTSKKSSVGGLKEALQHLKSGKPFGVFPAGEVSNVKYKNRYIDKPWNDGIMRLIQKSEVPVVPFYFHGQNSKLFYRLSKIHPILQTAKLPSELFSQKNKVIEVRIGKPISVKKQSKYPDLFEYKSFLRNKTYLLANSFEKENVFKKLPKKIISKTKNKPKQIGSEVHKDLILKDIQHCKEANLKLFTHANFEVFSAQKKDVPNIILEIGRLREITYRTVGEGTNLALDLDKYDDFYHHLFLWDNHAQTLVGAYRMGLGAQLYKNHGIKGFYSNSLFRFEPELYPMLSKSIEMGRAFVRNEYQRKTLPLFLLWKGIMHFCSNHPKQLYLIGGVTISDKYSRFSMSLMIEFMKSNYYDPFVAQYVKPKKEYKVKLNDIEKGIVFNESEKNLKQLEYIISDIEPDGLRIPVLLKKYIKQNAKLIAFNIDPLFNNAVDGLMYIKISDIPQETVLPLINDKLMKV